MATALLLRAATASGEPEYGIASAFPHDVGLSSHPSVIFNEDFEEASLEELHARWEEVQWPESFAFSSDRPDASGGQQSVHATSVAALYRRLLPGYTTVYARYYFKIDPICQQIHHWPWLGGRNPSTSYPFPQAGIQPNGADRFSTGVEPIASEWAWDFYTYWKDQGGSPDNMYWGNTFLRTQGGNGPSPYPVTKGAWTSVELMVRLNEPVSASNGEQAFWVNGEKLAHVGPGFPTLTKVWDKWVPDAAGQPFPGFQWRTVPELLINYFWLEHFVDTDPGCTTWFDDVVLATEYIGPLVTEATPPPTSSGTGGTAAGGNEGSGRSVGSGSSSPDFPGGSGQGGGSSEEEGEGCATSGRPPTTHSIFCALVLAASLLARRLSSRRDRAHVGDRQDPRPDGEVRRRLTDPVHRSPPRAGPPSARRGRSPPPK